MEFFKKTTHINFMGLRKASALFSVFICVVSLAGLIYKGLNLGLDFTGGTQIIVRYEQPADLSSIREQLTKMGYGHLDVQHYGASSEVLIAIPANRQRHQAHEIENLVEQLSGAHLQQVEFIGPKVGQELMSKGLMAIVLSIISTMLYIFVRFESRFAISAALALLHDPVVILGIFAWTGLEFDLIALSAVLAVIGYSLNDTIVVFDRVRENFRHLHGLTADEVMNLSINQTLSRTLMTSGMTLFVVFALLFFGGELLKGFSIAMIVGIAIGTYSSIYVAGALAVSLGLNRQDFQKKIRVVDSNP